MLALSQIDGKVKGSTFDGAVHRRSWSLRPRLLPCDASWSAGGAEPATLASVRASNSTWGGELSDEESTYTVIEKSV